MLPILGKKMTFSAIAFFSNGVTDKKSFGLYYKHILTILNDASTINVIDDASLALASIVNYDRK
jgi:hypothetical protein